MLKIVCKVLLLICYTLQLQMTTAGTVAPSANAGRNAFASDLLKTLTTEQAQNNVIFSPASIHAALTMAFIGAEGHTSKELRRGLKLGEGSKEDIARYYGDFLKREFRTFGFDSELKMANRIYVNKSLKIEPKFNDITKTHFNSEALEINFADKTDAMKEINGWVEKQTNNKIKNLIKPGIIDQNTSAILVNAIYFKAKWAVPFSLSNTRKSEFYLNDQQQAEVDMMFEDGLYKYADVPELDATVVEFPYENTDLSMMVILPNKRNGLTEVEQKLSDTDLSKISAKLRDQDVAIFLPRFKIEFDVDLKVPLEELGMGTMFTDIANFGSLFTDEKNQQVSEVRHKAYLEVNEAGSEAAAATFMKIVPMSLNVGQKQFKVDHPFVFAIRNNEAVYFAGHVAKF